MSRLQLRLEGLHWVEADGEVVALDDRSMQYLSANPVGALIWRALADGTTRDELVRRVVAAFEVEETTAAADVDTFLAELNRLGLLDG
jgi:Coenzyme PQQ synthesis protein D (PqqD)